MDVSESPEILKRQMYEATGKMAVERPVVEQGNDIDAPFSNSSTGAIPQHLQDLIQQPPSVDPEPQEIGKVESDSAVDAEKVTEENPNSRFRVLDVALLSPGTCALCGSSGGDGRQFVDFGKTVDFFGCVYFCTFCVIEAANLLGMASKSDFETQLDVVVRHANDADVEFERLQEKLNAAMVLLRDCTCSNTSAGSSSDEIPEAELIESSDSDGSSESSDGDEPNPDESVAEPGSDDVSATSSDVSSVSDTKPRRTRKSAG